MLEQEQSILKLIDDAQQIPENTYNAMNKMNQTSNCMLMMGQWNILDAAEACKQIDSWYIKRAFFIQFNKCPFIIRDIQNIKFPYLQKLFLRGNHIQSIEALTQLRVPVLDDLWIGQNKISEIKSLQKMDAGNLISFTSYWNHVRQIDLLNKCFFPNMKNLSVDFDGSFFHLLKLQTNDISRTDIRGENKIMSEQMKQKFKSRFLNANDEIL